MRTCFAKQQEIFKKIVEDYQQEKELAIKHMKNA